MSDNTLNFQIKNMLNSAVTVHQLMRSTKKKIFNKQ